MKIYWGKLIGTAVLAEILPMVALVIVVLLFGPGDAAADQAFAAETGRWFGPVVGALVTFLLGLWLVRRLDSGQLAHGVLLGVLVALLDATILVAGSTPFEWLFVYSGLGRVAAGSLAGLIGSRRTPGVANTAGASGGSK